MMAVTLDHDGIEEMLKSAEVAAAVHELAQQVAANVQGVPDGAEVVVDDYETDRAASSVTIKHAAGLALQAKYGTLTQAASAAGLEVTER